MSAPRQLWTGPTGAAVRDRLLSEAPGGGPTDLWIVPTELAREQVAWGLGRMIRVGRAPRVWTWDDLWRTAMAGRTRGPALLSPAGARAALREAIERAGRDAVLKALGPVVATSGVQRRLRSRIASWTRQGRNPRGAPPRPSGPVDSEEWAIFGRYREVLREIGAEDAAGFAERASRALRRETTPELRSLGRVTILDPLGLDRAASRALEVLHERAEALVVTLPFDPDPALREVYGDSASIRDRLLARGFEEVSLACGPERPIGLRCVERAIFRDGAHAIRLDRTDGLTIEGAPQGEGEAALVARRVKGLLEAGVEPEAILVLFRRWGEAADLTLETMRAWGLPASGSTPRRLDREPAASAIGLATSLPAGGWETSELVRLLRHGQVRPDWAEARAPLALATTASAVRDTRVFREPGRVREALRRLATVEEDESIDDLGARRRRAARARVAIPVFDRLAALYDGLNPPAPWSARVDQLRALATGLGIGSDAAGLEAIGHLFEALDDQGDVFASLGRDEASWTWDGFADEVRSMIRDLEAPAPSHSPGSVRVLTVDEAEGTLADHVILAGLAEGAFPDREAIEPGANELEEQGAPGRPENPGFAREMSRFLRVVGSAGATLTLVHPTADEKGQALLAAGFVDDVRRLFTDEARPAFARPIARLDPALVPADLAGAPADARVRAVALVGQGGRPDELGRLARSPEHREALLGAADALRAARSRSHDREFGPFDGRLIDPKAIRRIADAFAPDRHAFSPSQLESLAYCPFQFFQRYVLRLEPSDDRDELDDDRSAHGSLIHRVLETLHLTLRDVSDEDGAPTSARVAGAIAGVIDQVLDGEIPAASDVDAGLRAIQGERLRRVGRRYAGQYGQYAERSGLDAQCRHVEVAFGQPGDADGPPPLILGDGPDAVRLRGKIDRIDLVVPSSGRVYFRVIDYKSGGAPGRSDVEKGLALQLPLYALAVDRNALAGPGASPLDAGYWVLGAKGYSSIVVMARPDGADTGTWESFRERLERYVLDLVCQLRRGVFPVHPRADGCTRLCDFHVSCRIAQVRSASKTWADEPRMDPAR